MDTETGALSVEDAVAHLSAEEAVEDQPEIETVESDQDDAPETASEDVEIEDDGDEDSETQADDDPEQPAIDPPKSWDAEARERFAQMPRELQEYVLARETERDRGVSAQQQRAAEARQRADAEAQLFVALKPRLEGLISQAQQQFQTRWQGMDATAWQQLAQTDPNRYVQAKAAYDADVQAQQQLTAARQQAEAVEYQQFSQAQTARLPEVAPDLAADPKVQGEVFDYIAKQVPNLSPEDKRWITAEQFLLAWKAMKYDQVQAPKPKPQGRPNPTVKPGAPPIPQNQRQRSQREAAFNKAPTVENALKLLT